MKKTAVSFPLYPLGMQLGKDSGSGRAVRPCQNTNSA